MRWFVLIVTLFALAATASAGTMTKATLRVVDQTPLTVRGTGFHVQQAVLVTVKEGSRALVRRQIRSGSRGGFTVRFVSVTLHRCSGDVAISARDASGRLAVAKLPQPDCPPPLAP